MNARIKKLESNMILGKYGDVKNDSGQKLVDKSRTSLSIRTTSGFIPGKSIHKFTWHQAHRNRLCSELTEMTA